MEKSFTHWRDTQDSGNDENESDSDDNFKFEKKILAEDSDSESLTNSSSQSKLGLIVPDSDESFITPVKSLTSGPDERRQSVVPDSDDEVSSEKSYINSFQSLSGTKPRRSSKQKSFNISNRSMKSNPSKITNESDSSPDIKKSARKKNNKFVIKSDDENSSPERVAFNISDVLSGEESDASVKPLESGSDGHNRTKSSNNSYKISESEDSPEKIRKNASDDSYIISENEESPVKSNHSLETSNSRHKPLHTIDLTLPLNKNTKHISESTGSIDLTNNIEDGIDCVAKGKYVITISSDSEDDKRLHPHMSLSNEDGLNEQLKKVNLSNHDNLILSKEDSSGPYGTTNAFHQTSGNDYSSRLESLKAEQTRLDAQVKEVLKSIDSVKSSLKMANVTTLPDKGVRLQLNLKKFESKLRDLRYQQNTLSNEIIKLQIMPNKSSVPKPIQPQIPQQKMYKLPTTTTDINAMGKRALETHRTQQALTVDALRALHNSLKNCPSENTLASDPAGLKVELMSHQKYALSWLLWREREKPSGGILADDMGLGKTLTMISLVLKSNEENQETSHSDESENEEQGSSASNWLSSQRSKLIPGKTLVVCPASLIGQWEGEVLRRVRRGTIDVLVHHGQNREKKARRLAKPDLVVTTYNIVSRDAEQSESPLFQIKWERIILDEAHQIRNHKTKMAQGVFKLKGRFRWVLTGTPVQNKGGDLYALLKFLRCSPFDDLGVWKAWVDNRDAAGQQRMNTIIKSIMLRRTKTGLQEIGQLSNLPDKKFNTVMVTMDKEEWAVYEMLLNFSSTLFATFLHQKAEKENALQGIPLNARSLKRMEEPFKDHPELARLHNKMKEITDVKSHHILVLLLRLRQFCCHPSLITSMLENDDIANVGVEDSDGLDIDLMDKMTRMSIVNQNETFSEEKTDLTPMDKDNPLFSKDRLSSKLRRVIETLEDILASGDKLLVVSQWVSYLDLVDAVLQEKQIKSVKLTGQVAVKDRAEIVEKFNRKDRGPRVMLLSLTAGGVGLNLVGANHLLLLDLHWNPQLENQACDRIYRVGQEKNVQIYKFVATETVEERVLQLQEKKLNVADAVLTGAKHISSKLTLDDLKMLFKVN